SAVDRFTATWLASRIGETYSGRINGVTRFGLFVTLDENGADGLVPMRSLSGDFFVHDEKQHALVGKRTGRIYQLGPNVMVRISEADGLTGSSVFEIQGDSADPEGIAMPKPQRGRPDRRGPPKGKAFDKKRKFGKKPPQKGKKPKKR